MESGVFLKIKGRTKGFRAPWQQDLCMSPHFSSPLEFYFTGALFIFTTKCVLLPVLDCRIAAWI